jgi:hypothetical protein
MLFLDYDKKTLNSCLETGIAPIAPIFTEANHNVEDYNPITEKGWGFLVSQEDFWHYFEAIVRAKETYKFPYDWRHLTANCQKQAQKD